MEYRKRKKRKNLIYLVSSVLFLLVSTLAYAFPGFDMDDRGICIDDFNRADGDLSALNTSTNTSCYTNNIENAWGVHLVGSSTYKIKSGHMNFTMVGDGTGSMIELENLVLGNFSSLVLGGFSGQNAGANFDIIQVKDSTAQSCYTLSVSSSGIGLSDPFLGQFFIFGAQGTPSATASHDIAVSFVLNGSTAGTVDITILNGSGVSTNYTSSMTNACIDLAGGVFMEQTVANGAADGIVFDRIDLAGNVSAPPPNTPPSVPTFLFPVGGENLTVAPVDINVTYPADADGDPITLEYYLNGTSFFTGTTNTTTSPGVGVHEIKVNANDGTDDSGNATVVFEFSTVVLPPPVVVDETTAFQNGIATFGGAIILVVFLALLIRGSAKGGRRK